MTVKEIIIVTIALGNDGAERVLTELANYWANEGNRVIVLQTGANNYGCSYSISDKVELCNVNAKTNNKILRYIKDILNIIKFLRSHPYATALSFIVSSSFELAISSLFVKNKVVLSERNNPSKCPSYYIAQKLRNLSFELADICVFQTTEAKEYFSSSIQKKGVLIPNPANPHLPSPYKGERRKVIVTACRLHPQKNLKMMIDAFSLLIETHHEYVLHIYGQGEMRDELIQYIKSKGLQEKVHLMGFCSNLFEEIIDASLYVSSSNYEGISNSMLEALIMGIPTIATDCPMGGARMCIKNGYNGLLIPVGDIDCLYRAMKKIILDPEYAAKLSSNAIKLAGDYSIDKIAYQWLQIL